MTDQELEELLNDLESDRLERKESASDGDRIRQAICAFANDLPDHQQPGILFIGANDRGEGVGLAISDQLLLTLANMRSDGNILPMPSMVVLKQKLKGHDMAVVIVQPSDSPPVRYKGTVWVRVGPRRGIANPDDERRLSEKRRFRDIPADIRPILSAPMSALDDMVFQRVYIPSAVSVEVLEQNERDIDHQYLAAKFAHPGPPACPTVLGLLSVGQSPTDWIPGDYVQFLRIDGTSITDPVQSARELRGPLPDILSELDELLKINIQATVDFTSATTEMQRPDYPLVALQQIVRNAVLHRSYENTNAPVRLYWFRDRVEIQNPGGPFGQVTRANFGMDGAYDYRNPNLAAVMRDLGYVQRFGMGIAMTRHAMATNGNPAPEFQVEDSFVAVILRRQS